MSTVGETLRKTREGRGLTVHHVAEVTKMRVDHVLALEEGNYEAFPAKVYIRGFVRSYAKFLGIDFDDLSASLEKELDQIKRFRESPLARSQQGWLDVVMLHLARANWRLILPVLVLLAAGLMVLAGYQLWQRHKSQDPLSKLGSGYYTPPPEASAVYLAPPTNPPPRRNR